MRRLMSTVEGDWNAVALLAIALVVGTLLVGALVTEAAPLFGPPSNETSASPEGVGLSQHSYQASLSDCIQRLDSLYWRTRPGKEREMLASACDELATRAVAAMPSFSFAWFAGASAASALGDIDQMNLSLLRSELTGPSEQWIAEARVDLSEAHRKDLDAGAARAEDADLKILAQGQSGIGSIVRRYLSDPEFRPRITSLIETLPATVQQHFLDTIQRMGHLS